MNYTIWPPEEMAHDAAIELPLSKSESNRQLIIAALTPGGELPQRVAQCDDTDALLAGVRAGLKAEINVGAAGTAMRFLTAYFAVTPGAEIVLDGSERMRRRPIGQLVGALRSLGARIDYLGEEGFPPLRIEGRALEGGEVELDASVSSQFVSALLMVAPTMTNGLKLRLKGKIVSAPYILMTLELMRLAGVESKFDLDYGQIDVPRGVYRPTLPPVEADWSAASYWYELSAISAETLTLKGLRKGSLQGDAIVDKLFSVTGLRSGFLADGSLRLELTPDAGSQLEVDFSDFPDLAQTLAVSCCLLGIPYRFCGLESLRIKETDRIAALQMELSKLGFITDAGPDFLNWHGAQFDPGERIEPIATYDDHRMAMAFAPAALYFPGLQINDARVVTKSYPRFWDHLRCLGFKIEEPQDD